jgi:hopanoid biosynthesis associated RND transporter like protein HpnN
MRPPTESGAGRLLRSLTEAVFRRPRWFWFPQVLLVLVCLGYAFSSLRFSTDKHDLISSEQSYWRQFLNFKRDFNVHENLFVLVESGSREKNREFVERLAARLEGDGQFADVYYRAGLKRMGPKALLFLPEETLSGMQQHLSTNQPLFKTFSQATNLNTLFALVNRQFRFRTTPGSLSQSLPALQRIVDGASDSIESREIPLAPDIATFFGSSQELYLSFDHGRIYMLIAQAKNADQVGTAIYQLRKWIAQTRSEVRGVNVEITGEPVLTHDEMVQAKSDTELAALIALGLTALIFIVSCRGIVRPLIATFCLLIGLCYTAGFATLTVGRLNVLSITLAPILIGLTIDYAVHLIFRYEEELCRGQSRRQAIAKAIGLTGIGVVTNALTIAGAFYFIMLTDFKGMREMGLIAGSGVIVCLVPILTLLPLLLVAGKPDLTVPWTARCNQRPPDTLGVFLRSSFRPQQATEPNLGRCARIEQLYLKRPWLVLICGGLFTIFAIVGAFKVRFDYNLLHLQSRDLPAARMQAELARAGTHSLLYCGVIANSLPEALDWERRINQLPSVARVISLVKYLTEDQERKLASIREIKQEVRAIPLPQFDIQPVDLPGLRQTLFSLEGYLGQAIGALHSRGNNQASEETLRSLVNSVNRLRRLMADERTSTADRLTTFQRLLFGDLHETVSLIKQQDDRQRLQPEDVPPFLRNFFISPAGKFLLQVYSKDDIWEPGPQERFIRELRTVDPQVTGSPVQFYEYTSRLKQNIQKAALYATAIIALLVFLHFRRVSSVLLALLPVAIGFSWMLGLMGWLGIPFNPVNIVSLVLVIGIGVTNGVHILNRFAEEPQSNILAKSTGKAVLISALNTMVGFGSLLVAKHQGIASLGGVMAIATGTCVIASLALLPAVLTLLCRVD